MALDVLVIGGSRFIGKHLVLKLAENNDYNITVINRGKSNPNITYPQGVTQLKADRTNPEELRNIIGDSSFDYVIDVVLIYGKDAKDIVSILKGKIRKRYVYVSSASVYNVSGDSNAIESIPVYEEDPNGPTTDDQHWYLKEKRLCEEYLLNGYKEGDFPLSIVRPTYVYGPDNYIYREAYFYDRIMKDEVVLLPANTDGVLCDFVHVDDVVQICISSMESEQALGESFNATSGESVNPTDLTNLISKGLGKTPEIMYYSKEDLKSVDWPDKMPSPYPFTTEGRVVLSILKSANLLNFIPKTRLKIGLKDTYFEWYSKQSDLKFNKPDPEKLKQLEDLLKEKSN